MPHLVARSVGVRHEGAAARTPDGVDVSVAPGEVLLILGPSGCGKSTLALTFNGLVPHAVPAELEGEVLVAGVPTAERPVAELSEHVGMVFQDPEAQLVTRTVLDEVCFGPENRLVPAAEVEERAERVLRAVGLWDRRDDDPALLSGGGKQRLAIACALALDAAVLVLDEPTANLDPAGAEEVYRLLGELTAPGSRRSVVLVEHDLDRALPIVDSMLVLDGAGRPVVHGPAREVLRERAEELASLGVWLPTAALAGLRLRKAGVRLEPLPLSAGELTEALIAVGGSLPEGVRAPAPALATAPTLPTAPTIATVRHLTLRRGRREVLRDVSLDIRSGELLAIVGPNGAGKSTLVQALAGLLRVPRGTVAAPAAIGFVFQNPEHQFVASTVEDELAYGLRRLHLPDGEVARRVDAMLRTLGLEAHRSAHPFLLSGGQKRRLSVGTALIEGAPLLVLDEPTFGQDRARAADLLALLSDLQARGTTIVVVTHDLALAAEHADRVAIVDDGRVVALDAADRTLRDRALLEGHGLRLPALAEALAAPGVPQPLRGITRLRDLPGACVASGGVEGA